MSMKTIQGWTLRTVALLCLLGVSQAKADPTNAPVLLVDGVEVSGGTVERVGPARITMSSSFGFVADIYYTLDGSEPDFTAIAYVWHGYGAYGFFTLTNSATIRAIAYNYAYTDWAEAAPVTVQIGIPGTFSLLTSTVGRGSISTDPAPSYGTNLFPNNTLVTLTATPSNGWTFMRWTGDNTDTTSVTTVLMDRPRAVQAVFGATLDLFTNGSGQVLLNPPGGPYAVGSTVQVAAVPSPGYYFFGWAGAASGDDNPLVFLIDNKVQITALFGRLHSNEVSLIVLPVPYLPPSLGGYGNVPSTSVTVTPRKKYYTNGEIVTLSAYGYRTYPVQGTNWNFTNWSGDLSGPQNPMAITLRSSMIITANFGPEPVQLLAVSVAPSAVTIGAGSSLTITAQVSGNGPFNYEWFRGGFCDVCCCPLSTAPTLIWSNVSVADAGLYTVKVSDGAGASGQATASVALFGMEMDSRDEQPSPLLTLYGEYGTSYRLEFAEDLSETNWTLLGSVTLQEQHLSYPDTTTTNRPRRFYRAVPLPP